MISIEVFYISMEVHPFNHLCNVKNVQKTIAIENVFQSYNPAGIYLFKVNKRNIRSQ